MSEDLITLLEQKKYTELRAQLQEMKPADLAVLFEEAEESDLPLMFRVLPKELAAETFAYMDSDMQKQLIQSFSDRELREIISETYLDDTVDIIEEMPANVVSRILKNTDPGTRALINQVLRYPKDSAGSLMTVEYVSLNDGMTVGQAISRIRSVGVDKETIYTCYVTENRRLIGLVTVKDLLVSDDDTLISSIMDTNLVSVETTEDKERVAGLFSKYDVLALPVVDAEHRLVGIVTVDDAMDVMEEEATEDIEKMAAIVPTDKPYLKVGVFETWSKRIPWLLILMVSATFTASILTSFENALAAQVTLTAYIPMLMDTAGNSGSQSSVSIIRGLALGDIRLRDIFLILWKELRVSFLCGISLAMVGFVKILLIDDLLLGNGVSCLVALVVCLTMACTVVFAKIVGSLLPLLAKRLGFDPAVVASPVLTTIVDALSLLVYFGIATVLLHL